MSHVVEKRPGFIWN